MAEATSSISQQSKSDKQQCDFTGLLEAVTLSISDEENFRATVEVALKATAKYYEADHAYIIFAGSEAAPGFSLSLMNDEQEDGHTTVSNAVAGEVCRSGAGVLVADSTTSTQFAGDPDFQRFNVASAICVGIPTCRCAAGILYIDSRTSGKWDANHLEQLTFIGRHIALAVDSMTTQKSLEDNKRLIAAGKATLNLSHSVKNILQMIGGAAEVVDFGLRTNQIHRVKRSWDILKPNLERMRKYTLELLDYSKERKLNLGPCDFNRVIQGAIETLKSQLKEKNSKINIRIDQKMPTIALDSERIHEMALNLILNAIDIVDSTGGLVSVETKYDPDEQVVSLSVTDNGPGISDEMKDKIFTPFESAKKKFGTGLGMPIAKQIIDQHDGRIEIDSLPSRGTTFTVYFPAREVDASDYPPQPA